MKQVFYAWQQFNGRYVSRCRVNADQLGTASVTAKRRMLI